MKGFLRVLGGTGKIAKKGFFEGLGENLGKPGFSGHPRHGVKGVTIGPRGAPWGSILSMPHLGVPREGRALGTHGALGPLRPHGAPNALGRGRGRDTTKQGCASPGSSGLVLVFSWFCLENLVFSCFFRPRSMKVGTCALEVPRDQRSLPSTFKIFMKL